MTAGASAPILEIFPSIQGEGALVGQPQIFLRLGRCNIVCSYCDTPESIGEPPTEMRAVLGVGAGAEVETRTNPIAVADALDLCDRIRAAIPVASTVAVTGGEPLLHVDYLLVLLPRLRERGLEVLLETNGLLAGAMARVASLVDVASVDLKLAAETGIPAGTLARKHRAFLAAAVACPRIYCKIVVTAATTVEEVGELASVAASIEPAPTLFLTPVSPVAGGPLPPGLEGLMALAAAAADTAPGVRILPQLHPLAGWR
jgi:organic radical activating enzyme